MKIHYTIEGHGADDISFCLQGEVEGGNPIDPRSRENALREAFQQLTHGRATYGHPGEGGCRGPYKIKLFTLETAS